MQSRRTGTHGEFRVGRFGTRRCTPHSRAAGQADADQLSVLRAVAAAIALQHDFDLDTVEDIKLAVDEAATRLIVNSTDLSTFCVASKSPHRE